VGLNSLKSLNLTNVYPNNKNNNNKKNNKVKSKPLELFELAGKNSGNNSFKFTPKFAHIFIYILNGLKFSIMADNDVITLDSDDEDTTNYNHQPNLGSNSNGGGVTIKRIPAAPKVLPRPRPGPSGMPLPLPLPMSMAPQQQRKLPKKPGVFPPFALFSQEHREELLKTDPSMSFGEVGRRLGEMWHALSEDSKENYRRRAREISDQKMAQYQQTLREMPPQQRQQAINQANTPAKKRKTHGYAIFSSEMRKNLGNSLMDPQETAKVIAESWRAASPAVRQDYEARAARINVAQQRRYQQGMSRLQQQQPHPGQQSFQHINNASGSGLRISSVSSLSPQAKKRPPLQSQLGPKLPSSITISRVEPEVSIVSEQQPQIHVPPQRAPPQMMRGRPAPRRPMSAAAAAAMRVRSQMRPQAGVMRPQPGVMRPQPGGQQMMANGGNNQRQHMGLPPIGRGGFVNRIGRPYHDIGGPPAYGPPGSNGGLKRPAGPRNGGMTNAKMPKLMRPNLLPNAPMEQKLCRSCGLLGPVACRLVDRPELMQTLTDVTQTPIDLIKDELEGFPPDLCRRCSNALTSYVIFKRTFNEGQNRIKEQLARLRPTLTLPLPDSLMHTDSFAAVDIVDHTPMIQAEESILPDLDLDMDFGENPASIPQPVDIKQEKIKIITPTVDKFKVKQEDVKNDSIAAEETSMEETKVDKIEPTKCVEPPNKEKVASKENGHSKGNIATSVEDPISEQDSIMEQKVKDPISDKVAEDPLTSKVNKECSKADLEDSTTNDVAKDAITENNVDANLQLEGAESQDTFNMEESADAVNPVTDNSIQDDIEGESNIANGFNSDSNYAREVPRDSVDGPSGLNTNDEISDMQDERTYATGPGDDSSAMAEDSNNGVVPDILTEDSFVSCDQTLEQDPFDTDSQEQTFDTDIGDNSQEEVNLVGGESIEEETDAFVPEASDVTTGGNISDDHDQEDPTAATISNDP
jgi:hypothetical protein